MVIKYEDEYGTSIFWNNAANSHPANIGDTVIVDEEAYRVKSRVFYPKEETIVIVVSQGSYRTPVAESSGVDAGRLSQLNAAIINTNKRTDAVEKKNRALNEQIVSVRKHINQRIQQDKKDKDENR